jgi:copper homeostasis protein CutC
MPGPQIINLSRLIEISRRIAGPDILPGGGINADNLADLLDGLPRLTEIHLTASEAVDDRASRSVERFMEKYGFGQGKIWKMNEEKLRAVFAIIDRYGQAITWTPEAWEQEISSLD